MVADGHIVDTTHHSFTLTGFECQKFLKKGAWEGGRGKDLSSSLSLASYVNPLVPGVY